MDAPGDPRRALGLSRPAALAFVTVAVGLGLFQLYSAGLRPVGLFVQRGTHLGLVQLLAFLLVPTPEDGERGLNDGWPGRWTASS